MESSVALRSLSNVAASVTVAALASHSVHIGQIERPEIWRQTEFERERKQRQSVLNMSGRQKGTAHAPLLFHASITPADSIPYNSHPGTSYCASFESSVDHSLHSLQQASGLSFVTLTPPKKLPFEFLAKCNLRTVAHDGALVREGAHDAATDYAHVVRIAATSALLPLVFDAILDALFITRLAPHPRQAAPRASHRAPFQARGR
eukprot:5468575-Pleurochrysis_carterae.AAC.2